MTEKIEFLLEAIELRLGELVAVFQDINTTLSAQKIVKLPKPTKKEKPVVAKKVSTSDNLVENRLSNQGIDTSKLEFSVEEETGDEIVRNKWIESKGKREWLSGKGWETINTALKKLGFKWIKIEKPNAADSHWRYEQHEI